MVEQVFVDALLALYLFCAAGACYGGGYLAAWLCWRVLLTAFGTVHRGVLLRVTRFGTYAIGYDVVYVTVLLADGRTVDVHASVSDLEFVDPGDPADVLLPGPALARWLPPGPRARVVLLCP